MVRKKRQSWKSVQEPFVGYGGQLFVVLDALIERRRHADDSLVLIALSPSEAGCVARLRVGFDRALVKLLAPRIQRRTGLDLGKVVAADDSASFLAKTSHQKTK